MNFRMFLASPGRTVFLSVGLGWQNDLFVANDRADSLSRVFTHRKISVSSVSQF